MSSAPSSADTDPVRRALDAAAERILDAIVEVGALNPVVLIDGRSGSGKTSLAHRLVVRWPLPGPVQLVALDSLYPGWDGLVAGVDAARDLVLRPHARGLIGIWRRWDWESSSLAEAHAVDPALPLIVEGAGLLTAETGRLADVRVWLDSPEQSRMRRALQRDGETYRPHWNRWAQQEDQHIDADAPRDRASLTFTIP